MNRRKFFGALAVAAPALFIPKLIAPVWKRFPKSYYQWGLSRLVSNPEWESAPYQLSYYWCSGAMQQVIHSTGLDVSLINGRKLLDASPIRLRVKDGQYEAIDRFILEPVTLKV